MAEHTEPTWDPNGQVINTEKTSLCLKRDPYILTGLFTQFTRNHFFNAANIINEQLKEYLWTVDETTRIQIEPSYKWNPTVVQRRPAVYIKREAIQVISNYSLGHGRHLSHFEKNETHKGVDYTVFVTGGHTLICVGQSGAEADRIGLEVFFKYLAYKEPLQKEAKLGAFSVQEVSPVQKVDENKENWMVSIKLSWNYSYDWTLYQDAPILKRVAINSDIS